jgi:uncharacterized protein with von Willebrand factor type A (vWA) domain
MERVLAAFVRALRAAGSPVSTAETIDAVKAVALIGYGDRNVLKNTLAAVLAKSEDEKSVHDALFELYFNRDTPPPEALQEEQAPGGESDVESDFDLDVEALMDLAANGGRNAAAAIEQAAAAAGAENIRFATQVPHFVRRTLQLLGIDHLDQRILERLQKTPGGGADADKITQAMMAARETLQRLARQQVARYFEVYGKSATENFMNDVVANRAIDRLSEHDQARMKTLVAKLAKRLADKHARRRKLKDRGALDVRKTIRRATAHDGVPFDVVWKVKKRDRPKIVVLCDVSGSVARYVGFLLLLLYALHEKVADLRAFAFAARLADVEDELRDNDVDDAMIKIVRRCGGSTDYGKALADLVEEHPSIIDRRTTVLILGDARSNYGNPRLDLFRELADRSKRIVWLNPELPMLWGYGDSVIEQYRPFCASLTHCATVADIERAIDDILKVYD